jgi:hypothetical protein
MNRILERYFLVEAAGIEPASESMLTQVSTYLFCFFISDNETPADGLFIIPSPFVLPRGQEKHPEASLLSDTIPETQAISG